MLKSLIVALIFGAIMVGCGGASSPQYLDTPAVVQALGGYELTDESEMFYGMVFASDGRKYHITPGPYSLEIYVYASKSLMQEGQDVLSLLAEQLGGVGVIQTHGNALLILNRSGGPTPTDADMDRLIADLRD